MLTADCRRDLLGVEALAPKVAEQEAAAEAATEAEAEAEAEGGAKRSADGSATDQPKPKLGKLSISLAPKGQLSNQRVMHE